MDTIKPKLKIWKWLLLALGTLVLIYAVYFIYQVLTIRNQILSGNYDWEQYGAETSGTGGANVGSRTYQVATNDDPAVGAEQPKVTIVEFGDFQCPFCKKAFPIIRSVVSRYSESVRFIYRDFPLPDHPDAELAAQAGYCAAEQGVFWNFHDKVFQNQDDLSRANLINLAVKSGVAQEKFLVCLGSQAAAKEVKEDTRAGRAAGVVGTPTWFINGYRAAGVIPEGILQKIIESLIND